MKIMVFLHSTVLMHPSGMGRIRQERVRQVLDGDETVYDACEIEACLGLLPMTVQDEAW
jgi:hypothetical protein